MLPAGGGGAELGGPRFDIARPVLVGERRRSELARAAGVTPHL
jgi:hypothetical protein